MRAPIDFETAPHAHETSVHLADKIGLALLFEKFDFDYVLLEHGHSDVIGVRCCGAIPEVTASDQQQKPSTIERLGT
jgi:hypothetical protein